MRSSAADPAAPAEAAPKTSPLNPLNPLSSHARRLFFFALVNLSMNAVCVGVCVVGTQFLLEKCVLALNEFLLHKTEFVILGFMQPLPLPGCRESLVFLLLREPWLCRLCPFMRVRHETPCRTP